MIKVPTLEKEHWKIISGVLMLITLAQYSVAGIKEAMYVDTIIVHRRNIDEIEKLKLAVLKIDEEIGKLDSKDRRIQEQMVAMKAYLDRDIQDIKDTTYKPIKRVR